MVSKLSIPNHLFQTFYLKSTKPNRPFYTILTNHLLQSTHPKESSPYNTIKTFHSIPSAPNYLSKPSIQTIHLNHLFQTIHFKPTIQNHPFQTPIYLIKSKPYIENINAVTVPDRRCRIIPEVVLVGRWAIGVLGIWRGEGLGKGLGQGRSVYKQPETEVDGSCHS
jgi:hypothetical protein